MGIWFVKYQQGKGFGKKKVKTKCVQVLYLFLISGSPRASGLNFIFPRYGQRASISLFFKVGIWKVLWQTLKIHCQGYRSIFCQIPNLELKLIILWIGDQMEKKLYIFFTH
jgi:hypothetical protein